MKKYLLILAAIAGLAACSESKKEASTDGSTSAEQQEPAKLITAMCQRDFGTAKQAECVQAETIALADMQKLHSIPKDVVERCASVPNTRYTEVMTCVAIAIAPKHKYAVEDDGEYGYERALSENDRAAGQSATSLMMFRYLGEKNGTYTVSSKNGPSSMIASCKNPCEFIKLQTIYAGQVVQSETIKSSGSAVIDAVLLDARNGQLVKYKSLAQ